MDAIATIQYLKAEDIPFTVRIDKELPSTGFIKKIIRLGSVITEMTPVDDPVKDILQSLSSLKSDFSSLKDGEISDIRRKE